MTTRGDIASGEARRWLPLLLADPSPCLRLRVLRDLLGRDESDPEVRELADLRDADPLVAGLVELQAPDGSWSGGDRAWPARTGKLRGTWQALMRLGYLGLGSDHPAVRAGAEYLFSLQRPDGAWEMAYEADEGEREGYDMVPLQTALPLRALAACGLATDPRSERAYDWLLAQRLADGAWPAGIASGTYGYIAGYRRLAHSRWGCRSNTTGALVCLAHHPSRSRGPEARRALDLLLGRETREESALGWDVARTVGAEPSRGFFTYYARFDLGLVLDICWRLSISLDDDRVAALVDFVQGCQGRYGLWEYAAHLEASRWVSFDVLRSLARLRGLRPDAEWVGLEPRTPFQPYPRVQERY